MNIDFDSALSVLRDDPTDLVAWSVVLSAFDARVPLTRTINGKDLTINITLDLDSSDFANQGTTTTVLHGNATGNPSWGTIVTADINNSSVTLAKIENITTNRILGRKTANTGVIEQLTPAQATAVLDLFSITDHDQGLVVGSNGADNTNFLRADNTWAVPSIVTWADMPIATRTTLGGVIIGSGLTVDTNGVINAIIQGGVGTVNWGAIGGLIANQTDISTALNLKALAANPTFTGNITVADGLTIRLGAGKGLIQFDDEVVDTISFLNCSVGIGGIPGGNSENLQGVLDITGTLTSGIYLRDSNSPSRLTIAHAVIGDFWYGTAPLPTMIFTNSVERMRILSSGEIGIGTETPSSLLTVNGLITTTTLKVTTGAAAGNILISDADGDLGYLAAGATTEVLMGGGVANPIWTTTTGTGVIIRAGDPIFTTSFGFAVAKWRFVESGNHLLLNFNSVTKGTLEDDGTISFVGDVIAFAT
jgi:hypothetical protein